MIEKTLAVYQTNKGAALANEAIGLVVNGNSGKDIRKFFSSVSSDIPIKIFGSKNNPKKRESSEARRTLEDLKDLVDDIRYGMEKMPVDKIHDILDRLDSEPEPDFLSDAEEEIYRNMVDTREEVIKILWGCEYAWKQKAYEIYTHYINKILGIYESRTLTNSDFENSFGWLTGGIIEAKTKYLYRVLASTVISALYDRSLLAIPLGHNLDKTQHESEKSIEHALKKRFTLSTISIKEARRAERSFWRDLSFMERLSVTIIECIYESLDVVNTDIELDAAIKKEIADMLMEIFKDIHKECLRLTVMWYYKKANTAVYTKILASFAIKHVPFGCLKDEEISESQNRAIAEIETKIAEILPSYVSIPEHLNELEETLNAGSILKISNEFIHRMAKIIISATDDHSSNVETFISGMKQNIDTITRRAKNYFNDISNGTYSGDVLSNKKAAEK